MRIKDKRTYSFTLINQSSEMAHGILVNTDNEAVETFTSGSQTEIQKKVPIGLTVFVRNDDLSEPTAKVNGATAKAGQTDSMAYSGFYLVNPHPSVGDIVEMKFGNL